MQRKDYSSNERSIESRYNKWNCQWTCDWREWL